jgi:hypothetical protein
VLARQAVQRVCTSEHFHLQLEVGGLCRGGIQTDIDRWSDGQILSVWSSSKLKDLVEIPHNGRLGIIEFAPTHPVQTQQLHLTYLWCPIACTAASQNLTAAVCCTCYLDLMILTDHSSRSSEACISIHAQKQWMGGGRRDCQGCEGCPHHIWSVTVWSSATLHPGAL